MAGLTFLIALLCGCAALLYQQAGDGSSSWVSELCSTSQLFCHHPDYLADASFALLIIAIGVRLGRLVN